MSGFMRLQMVCLTSPFRKKKKITVPPVKKKMDSHLISYWGFQTKLWRELK